jgi:fructose 1,6-bisphosphate aldolase/phosphatase
VPKRALPLAHTTHVDHARDTRARKDVANGQAYNFPLYMDHKGAKSDRIISLKVPEQVWDVACLLQNPDRFGVEAIHSRYKPEEQIVSVSATRLHNIAGTYTGKDDPVATVRTQGIFPAPEEVVEPTRSAIS